MGISERALGDPRVAADCYRRALVTHAGHADVWFNLGNALLDAGDAPGALEAYAGALERQPAHTGALEQVLRVAPGQKRPDLALDAAQRLAAVDPRNVERQTGRITNNWPDYTVRYRRRLRRRVPDDVTLTPRARTERPARVS